MEEKLYIDIVDDDGNFDIDYDTNHLTTISLDWYGNRYRVEYPFTEENLKAWEKAESSREAITYLDELQIDWEKPTGIFFVNTHKMFPKKEAEEIKERLIKILNTKVEETNLLTYFKSQIECRNGTIHFIIELP